MPDSDYNEYDKWSSIALASSLEQDRVFIENLNKLEIIFARDELYSKRQKRTDKISVSFNASEYQLLR